MSTAVDDTELVLLHLETQQYYSLNETVSHIWQLFTQDQNAGAIASTLTKEWNVSRKEALRSVRAFL